MRELYHKFQQKYPDIKIGISSFKILRPIWCITVSFTEIHNVCVCVTHQNSKFLTPAANIDKDYKELISLTVFSLETKDCMFGRCKDCPGIEPLKAYLERSFENNRGDVVFKQWISTDRC